VGPGKVLKKDAGLKTRHYICGRQDKMQWRKAAATIGGRDRQAEACRTYFSEVRLDPIREAHGHGQGSGLSGKAESRVAGPRFAPLAAGQ